jgi:hypothetical protein
LNHIRPAALVEDIAFVTQPLREGLTVAAIADYPIGGLRPVDKPLKVAATALERVFQWARALWLVEPVSERLNLDDNAVLDPNTLHQKVRTKVVRPKLNLNVRAGSRSSTVNLCRGTAE